jgi:threonine dehydrogenase-like Zn-dependent dehydrogenase
MRGAVLHAPGDVRLEQRDHPTIIEPTDAVIRLSATCVCGSDLWPYRGIEPVAAPAPMGHEYVGIVEEVGSAVTTIKSGQFVVGSFWASDNTCEICQAGYQSSCIHRELMGMIGTQAEYARIPLAEAELPRRVRRPRHRLVRRRHEPRQQLAREFGATDIVEERGEEGVARIRDLTNGLGAHSVIEAVGTSQSMVQALGACRPGGHVGFVGVTHEDLPGQPLFYSHAHLHGGPAPVRRFLPQLIDLIWNRQIDPGKVFDLTLPLDQVAEGYRAMDERRAIKTLLSLMLSLS